MGTGSEGGGGSVSSTVMIRPMLEALRNVRHVMVADFSDVDVRRLHEFVDNGAAREIARNAQADWVYDPDKRTIVARRVEDGDVRYSERAAQAAFARVVRAQMPRFAQLMQAVAPILARYSASLEAARAYIRDQKRQSRTMMSFAIITFIVAYVLVVAKIMWIMNVLGKAMREERVITWEEAMYAAVRRVGRWVLLFMAVNTLTWAWIRMMRARVRDFEALDLSFYERIDRKLARNLFVRLAHAYVRGDQEAFVREQTVQQAREAEEETERLQDVCGEELDVAPVARDPRRRRCRLNGCDETFASKSLGAAMGDFLEHAWMTRNDVDACAELALVMLEYLAEVRGGSMFDERDRHSMWSRIHRRVGVLQRFVYRGLDVHRGVEGVEHSSEVAVVRDRILPRLRLTAVESRSLRPDGKVWGAVDGSYTSRLQTWRACLEDDDCVWAAFHPKRGAVFAVRRGGAVDVGEDQEQEQEQGQQEEEEDSIFRRVEARPAPADGMDGGDNDTVDDNNNNNNDIAFRRTRTRTKSGPGRVAHATTPLIALREGEEESEWTVLVKRANLCDVLDRGGAGGGGDDDAAKDDPDNSYISSTVPPSFVCGMGINERVEGALRALPPPPLSSPDDDGRGGGGGDGDDGGSRRRSVRLEGLCPGHASDDAGGGAGGEGCRVVSKPRGGAPQRWAIAQTPDVPTFSSSSSSASYPSVFAEPRSRADDTVYCLRVPPEGLFRSNLERNAFVTLHMLTPTLVDHLFQEARRHGDRIYLEDHEEYLFHELQSFYGPRLFERLKPQVQELLQRVRDRLETVWNAVDDRGTYVTQARFDDKIEGLGYTRVRKLVYETGRLSLLSQNYMRNFASSSQQEGGGGLSVTAFRQFLADLVFASLIVITMAITGRVHWYRDQAEPRAPTTIVPKTEEENNNGNRTEMQRPGEQVNARALTSFLQQTMLIVASAVLFLTLLLTNAARSGARRRFNAQTRERNARAFVAAATRTTEGFAQQLEHLAGRRIAGATRAFRAVRDDLAELYQSIGYVEGLKRLYPVGGDNDNNDNNTIDARGGGGGEDKDEEDVSTISLRLRDTRPPDTRTLYRQVRSAIDSFYACNALHGQGMKPPFPAYELVNYALVGVGALAVLGVAMYKLRPLLHVRYVRQLNELREDLRAGGPAPPDFAAILDCSRANDDVWPILSTVLMGLLLIAVVMMAVYMARSSSLYEMGLYASGLFTRGRCA